MEDTLDRDSWSPTTENLFESQYPLHRACRDGDLEALSMLMSAGRTTDFYQEDGLYGWTPIHWAAHFGKLACLRKLVIERSVGLDTITTKFSQTALHLCVQSGQPHCLQWLVQSGANTLIQDYMGEAPLHKCARTGNMECISLLISQGTTLNIRNHNGLLPSQLAAESGHQECAAYIERAMQLQQASGVHESHPTLNPSNNTRSDQPIAERVVTNGNAMEDDEDMETDLSVMPNTCSVAGTKRSREHCDEDECKKSRRDEPASWGTFNSLLQTNGLTNHNAWKNQNGFIQQTSDFNHHGSKKYQNGFSSIPNGSDHVKHVNGVLPQTNGLTCNNNSISVSNSSIEHYSSVSQERGYDCLLLDSISTGNQYDGS